MKAKELPRFISFAANFSIESIVKTICSISFDICKESNSSVGFISKTYQYFYQGKKYNVMVVQTWVLDLLFDLIKYYLSFSDKDISKDEALHLINMYNSFSNKKPDCDEEDIMLFVYGFFGEQMKIETLGDLIDDFSRENYILKTISKKNTEYSIDIAEIIKQETGYSDDMYSAMLMLIWSYCNSKSCIIDCQKMLLVDSFPFTNNDLLKVLDKYSATFEDIKNSTIKRQLFYSKPFIKFGTEYISVNPYLTLCLFANSNYWIIRDYFKELNYNKELFLRAFGKYFELYVGDIFLNCLSINEFVRIPEVNQRKRADWKLNLFGKDILIEQKSTISETGIKQNNTNVEAFKKYINNT